MSKFNDMIRGLQQDIEIPENVRANFADTLSNLPDKQGKQNVRKNRWMKYAASAAVIAIAGSAVCYTNQAFAAKIPVIGKIFEQVQHESTFSGVYSKKAEVLDKGSSETMEISSSEYSAENSGVKFKASEIYCDGLSVFLTAEVEIEQGGLNNIFGNVLYLNGRWRIGREGEEIVLINNNLEGKVIDDNIFVGMLKLDFADMDLQSDTIEPVDLQNDILELKLSMIGYDDINMTDEEDISAYHKLEGEWNLELPVTVDQEAVKTIPVNQGNNGYCLKEIFVSPYQIVTYTDVPYTEKEMTRKQFDEMMKEKTDGAQNTDLTYEQYMEKTGKIYADSHTIIFNQDGERLYDTGEYRGCSIHAVQDRTISKLYVYLFDDTDTWYEVYTQGMDCDAIDRAVVSAEVDVEQ